MGPGRCRQPAAWRRSSHPHKSQPTNGEAVCLFAKPTHPISALSLRFLHCNGIDIHSAAKKPFLTTKHKKNRLKFARSMVSYDWSQV